MSSITITFLPKCEEIPDWVATDLVGLTISLCTPQQIFCIGFLKDFGTINDITDVISNGFVVSPKSVIRALKEKGREKSAEWFKKKFKFYHSDPNGDIILIHESCCEYNS